jgi:hypothetical protein
MSTTLEVVIVGTSDYCYSHKLKTRIQVRAEKMLSVPCLLMKGRAATVSCCANDVRSFILVGFVVDT